MTTASTILAALSAPAYDVVRDEIRASYLDSARYKLVAFVKECADWTPTGKQIEDEKTSPRCTLAGTWTNLSSLISCHSTYSYGYEVAGKRYDSRRLATVAAAPQIILDEAGIQASADQRWEEAKAFYAARVAEKIDVLVGTGAAVELDVSRDQELTGYCTATVGGRQLVLSTTMKTNYRYGEHAADGHMTVYMQVPTVVVSAKGFDPIAVQAAHDAQLVKSKADRKDQIKALSVALTAASRRKDRWFDIHGTLTFARDCTGGVLINGNLTSVQQTWAELGYEGRPLPTLAEAKLGLKEARESAASAKRALTEAKAAK